MHQELVSISIDIQRQSHVENLFQTFVAPANIIRAFAEFLSDRDDNETFTVKESAGKFSDCSVKVGDSKQAVRAFSVLNNYNIPLGNYDICKDLVTYNDNAPWKSDENYRTFAQWYKDNNEEEEDDD